MRDSAIGRDCLRWHRASRQSLKPLKFSPQVRGYLVEDFREVFDDFAEC